MRLRGLAPLQHRGFRFLLAGQFTSNVGDMIYAVALPWYVLANHGGVLLLGTALAAYGVPRTVFIVVGGHASDRWSPWTSMMCADATRALAVGGLAVAAATGKPSAITLIPIAVVLGVGEGVFLPGSFSILPIMLPDADLQSGNAMASSGTQLATLIGPAIGGPLVATVGASSAFGLDAASFVVSAATLLAVGRDRGSHESRAGTRQPGHVPSYPEVLMGAEPAQMAADLGPDPSSGIRQLLLSERVLQIILITNAAANLGFGAESEIALPALARGPFHAGAGGYGALLATFGAGALFGTLIAAQIRTPRRPAILGSLAFLVEALVVSAVPYLGGAVGAGCGLAVVGAAEGLGNVLTITAFQRWAPAAVRGRLMSLVLLTSFGVFPVSVAVGALVVHQFGAAPVFPASGATLGLAILFALTQGKWREFGASRAKPRAALES